MSSIMAKARAYTFLTGAEGCRLVAYPDGGGWSIGYGRNSKATLPPIPITLATAQRYLQEDIEAAYSSVAGRFSKDLTLTLTDSQLAALISFTYSVGGSAFSNSTLAKCIAERDFSKVPEQLARWNKSDGLVVTGLVTRRYKEAMLWLS